MANEATIRVGLSIRKTNSGSVVLLDESYSAGFQADVTGTKGPTPGAIAVPTTGKLVYFPELTTPGLVWLKNLDDINYVEWGIFDPQSTPAPGVFYPLGELLPGEAFMFRFSRNLQEQYAGSGTGTTTPENYFYMKANKAACNVQVKAFEK